MTSEIVWLIWLAVSTVALTVWEFYCIFTGKKVLTFAARDALKQYPGAIVLLSFNLGVLFGHLFVA